MNIHTKEPGFEIAAIPMRSVGPVKIGAPFQAEIHIPLATFEKPLWPSVARGARISRACGGLHAVVRDERMTRSILLAAPDATAAVDFENDLQRRRAALVEAAESGSRFARVADFHVQVVGNIVFVRLAMTTGDAAGHNMVTAAADRLMSWILQQYPQMRYLSISGNYCTDKKNSAVNGILGRGRSVIVDAVIADDLCRRQLHTSPEAIVALNMRKNLLGSIVAGGVRTANAHFANMLLAFYLATGQDAANIVEGSQGFTWAELRGSDLYFSVTLPNLIVGTVGSGKHFDFVQANLERLGCLAERPSGENARRLAVLAAAAVWCGELSLLAAQTNPGELMRAHTRLERGRDDTR